MEPTPEQTAFMAKNWRDLIRPRTLEIEEHTSELQSLAYLVCRLLLEKKKNTSNRTSFIFFNDPATTEIYTLSLHDALPISEQTAFMAKNWRDLIRLRSSIS